MKPRVYMADEIVIKQGDEDRILYIILIGAVKVYMKEENLHNYLGIMKAKLYESFRKKFYIENAIAEK